TQPLRLIEGRQAMNDAISGGVKYWPQVFLCSLLVASRSRCALSTAPPIPELGGVCRFVAMAPAPCLLGGVMSGPSDDTASLGSCEPANGSNESRIERSLPTSLAPFWY